MKICRIFKLTTFLFFFIAFILIIFIILFSGNLKERLQLTVYLSEVDRKCTEKTILVGELRTNPSPRVMDQLDSLSQSIHDSFDPILKTHFYQKNAITFNRIHNIVINASKTIEFLSEYFKQEGYSVPTDENESIFLYTTQLLADTYQINQGIYEMIRLANEQLSQQLTIARIIIIMILAVFLIFALYHFRLLNHRVLKPLLWIDVALKKIHSGNFGYKINYQREDELGTVSKVFNEMSEKLEESTVSREKLEEELINRKKAERDLTREKAHAEQLAKEAQAANNAKDIFLANMSHEMRTPLTGIIGALALLEEQELPEDSKYLLKLSKESSKQMNHIIDDLLEMSKISFGKFELHEQYFDMAETLQKSYQLFLINAKEKELDFTVKKVNLPDQIYSDKTRIFQILNQLISNAIKFTSKGTVDVTAEFLKNEDKKGMLKLRIQDTGIGIDGSVMDHLYDYFYQKDMTLTKDYQGMGIGLTIVKYIVNAMEGKMTVKTNKGEGTTFTVTLPVQSYKEWDITNKQTEHRPISKPKKIKRILNVEDNHINRIIVRKILDKHGYIVEEAINGEEALEKVDNNHHFDLILMDIQMPRKDGYETRMAIREKYGEDAPMMVALTGYQSDEDKRKIKKAGFEGFLGKPYSEEELIDIIKKMES